MFARITRYKMKPDKMDEARAKVKELKPQIMALPGMIRFTNASRPDGTGYVISIVESQEMSDNNAEAVQRIWGNFQDYLEAMPMAEGFDVDEDWAN